MWNCSDCKGWGSMFKEGGIALWERLRDENHRLFCKGPGSNPIGMVWDGMDALGINRRLLQ